MDKIEWTDEEIGKYIRALAAGDGSSIAELLALVSLASRGAVHGCNVECFLKVAPDAVEAYRQSLQMLNALELLGRIIEHKKGE